MAIRYSDTIIALSERDSALLHKIYKRSADFLVPVTFDDKLDYNKLTERRDQKPRGIFAGSLFFRMSTVSGGSFSMSLLM